MKKIRKEKIIKTPNPVRAGDWYPVAAIVLSGVVVAMVTSVMSWKLLTWIRDRKRRYHEPLLNDGWSNEGKPKVIGKLLSLFHRGEVNLWLVMRMNLLIRIGLNYLIN